jgi:MoxR-like ATPase
MRCARVEAAIAGAEYVSPDHIKAVAPGVISHRLVLTPDAALEGLDPSDLTRRLLEQVEVPRE